MLETGRQHLTQRFASFCKAFVSSCTEEIQTKSEEAGDSEAAWQRVLLLSVFCLFLQRRAWDRQWRFCRYRESVAKCVFLSSRLLSLLRHKSIRQKVKMLEIVRQRGRRCISFGWIAICLCTNCRLSLHQLPSVLALERIKQTGIVGNFLCLCVTTCVSKHHQLQAYCTRSSWPFSACRPRHCSNCLRRCLARRCPELCSDCIYESGWEDSWSCLTSCVEAACMSAECWYTRHGLNNAQCQIRSHHCLGVHHIVDLWIMMWSDAGTSNKAAGTRDKAVHNDSPACVIPFIGCVRVTDQSFASMDWLGVWLTSAL